MFFRLDVGSSKSSLFENEKSRLDEFGVLVNTLQ